MFLCVVEVCQNGIARLLPLLRGDRTTSFSIFLFLISSVLRKIRSRDAIQKALQHQLRDFDIRYTRALKFSDERQTCVCGLNSNLQPNSATPKSLQCTAISLAFHFLMSVCTVQQLHPCICAHSSYAIAIGPTYVYNSCFN